MKKTKLLFVIAAVVLCLAPSSASARPPDNDGPVQRAVTDWFGGIGHALEDAGKSLAKTFLEKPGVD